LITYDPPAMLTTTISVGAAAVALTIPPATVNAASKSASASTRACYANSGTCNIAAAFLAKLKGSPPTDLPDFIVQTGTT
jgi:hypothetical protein